MSVQNKIKRFDENLYKVYIDCFLIIGLFLQDNSHIYYVSETFRKTVIDNFHFYAYGYWVVRLKIIYG